MELPKAFQSNILHAFGEQGAQWLAALPALLEDAAHRWGLVIGTPMLLSYNYVTAASGADGAELVLKIGVPNPELSSEMLALRLYNGEGCVRLLEADEARGMFLMERLRPGRMLVELEDDEERTRIAARVMRTIWRPAPAGLPFIQLQDWFAELKNLWPRIGSGPFPPKFVGRAEALIPELFATSSPPVLTHGDFHHYNVLSSERGWLVIDPKGVIGPPEYDCGPFLINPLPGVGRLPGDRKMVEKRIAILSEELGFPRQRIRDWGFCHAVLSAWWNLAPGENGGQDAWTSAELLAGL